MYIVLRLRLPSLTKLNRIGSFDWVIDSEYLSAIIFNIVGFFSWERAMKKVKRNNKKCEKNFFI
jgi:hypothetical protein